MEQLINIQVDDNQLVDFKIEIKGLSEKLIREYFTTSGSLLQKFFSDILLSCQ